jgi:STE24 endopeptidase
LKFLAFFRILNKPPSTSLSAVHPVSSLPSPHKVKTYNRIRLSLGLLSSLLTFLLLVVLVAQGWSSMLAGWAHSVIPGTYGALLLFVFTIALLQALITLPFGFVLGYVIEHRYGLSNQSLGRWAWERTKGVLVSGLLGAVVIVALYLCMEWFGNSWWAALGVFLTLVNVLLARLAPVLLIPVFYKVSPLVDEALRKRILALCTGIGFHVEGIYSFNLSKNTRKANAAFTGIGKAKRILLGDTLLQNFTYEEIETILAHELGHYLRRHILIGVIVSAVMTFVGLFVAAYLYSWSLMWAGFSALTELRALPLLAIWVSLLAVTAMPLGNMLSRKHEREADAFAVKATGNPTGFASALRKLASLNLADPEPHPLIEFLFSSHPSIRRRLQAVEGGTGP